MRKMETLLVCLIAISILPACKPTQMSPSSKSEMIQGAEVLYQYKWNLLELAGNTVISFKTPYLQISSGQVNRVSGNTGCNDLSGAIILSGERGIRFTPMATTRMACLGEYNEMPFLTALQRTSEWRVDNHDLYLYDGKTQLARFHGEPLFSADISGLIKKIDGSWELIYITGPRISFEGLFPDQKPELIINSLTDVANGHSSCNPFSCPMTIQGDRISFGNAMSTLMYCPGNGEPTFFPC